MNMAGMADDIPPQMLEQFRVPNTRCSNCPFAERDRDDGKLYCHEDSARSTPVFYFRPVAPPKQSVIAPAQGQQQQMPTPELVVHGVITYWPEVQPEWSCWKHPARQAERRRLECG